MTQNIDDEAGDTAPLRERRRERQSTVAAAATMHDVVTFAFDDWDEIWHPNRTVRPISPGMVDDIDLL
jgi:hypothetical protein